MYTVEVRECLLSFGAESFVFQFATQNIDIRIQRTIILPVLLYGCETWSLTLREKHRLRVIENTVLKKVFRPDRDEVTGSGENYIMKTLMNFTPRQISF